MGRIPEFKTGGVARTSQLVDVGQGIRDARIISNAVQNVAKAVDSGLEAADNVFIAKNEIKFKEKQLKIRHEFQEKFRQDPTNPKLFEEFQEQSQKDIDEFSSGLNRPQSRNAFSRMAQNQKLRTEDQLKTFQIQQTQENVLASNLESVDAIKNISLQEPGVDSAIDSLKQIDMLKVSNTSTLGAKNTERLFQQQQKQVATSFVDSNLEKEDISEVRKLLKEKRFAEALGPSGVLATKNKIKRLEAQREAKKKKLRTLSKSKPWRYLDKIGETQGLARLDFGNPMSFIKRREFMDEMSAKHDLSMADIPIHPAEIEGLKKTVLSSNDKDLTFMLGRIDDNLDDETKSAFGKQLFPKAPMLGAAMHLSGEDPDTALTILQGFKKIQSKGFEIGNSKMESEIDLQLKGSIPDPFLRQKMKEAIKGHVVQSVSSVGGNLKEDVGVSDTVKASIDAVLGPQIKEDHYFGTNFNSVKGGLRSFRGHDGEFITKDVFNDTFERLTPENIQKHLTMKPVDVDGNVIDLQKFGGRLRLQTIGDGFYSVIRTSNNLPLMSDKKNSRGEPKEFILNMKEFYNNITEVED